MDREAWSAAVYGVTESDPMGSRKMVPMKLFAGWEQRHADIENGCVGTQGKEQGGKRREWP